MRPLINGTSCGLLLTNQQLACPGKLEGPDAGRAEGFESQSRTPPRLIALTPSRYTGRAGEIRGFARTAYSVRRTHDRRRKLHDRVTKDGKFG